MTGVFRLLFGLGLWLAGTAVASAADLKLLTTGAFRPVAEDAVASFEKRTGNKVTMTNDTAGALMRRLRAARHST